jgi:hypothetical protein
MGAVKLFAGLLILLITAGCATVRVNQDYDPATDFSVYRAFAWKSSAQAKTGDIRIDNPLLDARIREAVERSLAAKGHRKEDQSVADYLVSYSLTVQSKIASSPVTIGTGFGIGGGGSFGSIGVGTPVVDSYEEGALVIDLYDKESGQLLWRGSGTRRLRGQADPVQKTQDINTLVKKILAQYPPPS